MPDCDSGERPRVDFTLSSVEGDWEDIIASFYGEGLWEGKAD